MKLMRAEAVEPGRLRRAAVRPVKRLGAGQYAVKGNHEPWYFIDLGVDPPCTCADAQFNGRGCLHEIAARLQEREPQVVMALGDLLLREQNVLREVLGDDGNADD